MSRTRQLAAIMFTDIKGYTALMQQDEEAAIRARDKHRRVFNAATEKYGGKVLQYYGDGTLSIFDSAIEAVRCAVEMQRGFREAPILPVRIGIHVGDIVYSEEEIIGDSVNIASRIESLAVPGSVFISEKVYDEVKNQQDIEVVRLRAFRLKNVERPMVVYAVAGPGLVVPDPDHIEGKTEPPPTAGPAPPPAAPFLATKLFPPPARPGTVRRERLLRRLDAGLNGRLTLLSAPAGFGKTTLAAEWTAGCGRPVAWLSLDEADGSPARFLAYFTAALRRVHPQAGENVLAMLHSPQPPPVEAILATLINEIAGLPDPFVLVLDDYHLVDARLVDEALAFLLDHLPPQLHLLITTREDPNLPLPRLRVRGQLTELRAADLRFTPAEAAAFLREAMGLDLPEEAVAALEARTEGWIAGLQMAALSMQGRTDTAGFIRAFTGSHRFVLDYLAEEVLQQQPPEMRRFLLQTAILERLCGPLCDAVTKQEDSSRRLEALERANLFVIPLDDERRWYRYHHLFADVLLAKLQEETKDEMPALHRRASEWLEAHDLPGEAVAHALAAADHERAAALIERVWPAMDANFQTAAWLQWVEVLPPEMVRCRPVLLMGMAWAYLGEGDLAAGQARLREAEAWVRVPDEQPGEMVVVDEAQFRSLPASIPVARLYLLMAQGDWAGTIEYAEKTLYALPADDPIPRGQATALLGLAYWSAGDLERAHANLSETFDLFRGGGLLQFAVSTTYVLADIRVTQGRLGEAVRTCERVLRLAEAESDVPVPGTAELHLGLGDLHRERGDLEAVDRELRQSEALGAEAGLPNWPWRYRVARARYEEARGNPERALELLTEAERLYFPSPVPEIRSIATHIARLQIREGRLAEARAWVRERRLSADDELTFLREFDHLTLAELLIAAYRQSQDTSKLQEVESLLERLLAAAEAGGRTGSMIEILIRQALAREAQEDIPGALAPLERALALAEPEGYVRIFADEGTPMVRLLSAAAVRGIRTEYAARLLVACGAEAPAVATRGNPIVQPLVEPLSERELEILALVAEGLSNQAISERLFLALSTVKGHNRNIFGKLGVQRRTEAVARARELGLL